MPSYSQRSRSALSILFFVLLFGILSCKSTETTKHIEQEEHIASAESVSVNQSGDSCQVNLENTLCTEFDLPKISGAGTPQVKTRTV